MTALLFSADHEQATLGAAMLASRAAETMLGILTPADFGMPRHQAMFLAIENLYRRGDAIDPLSVRSELERTGAAWPEALVDLSAMLSNSPAASSVATHAGVVADYALRRRAVAEATALQQAMGDLTKDPGDVLDEHRASLTAIDSPALAGSAGEVDVADFVRQDDEQRHAIVPGLLAADDRCIIVAGEGVGKSEVLRQLAVTVAYGIHPFRFGRITPAASLLVDLENPVGWVRHRLRALTTLAGRHRHPEPQPVWLWHRPGGTDLRRRANRLELEDVLRRRRPRLVTLGPIYKAYQRKAAESDEQVAAEVQTVLDDLRTRYNFALIAEHHAPQYSNGSRDLRPFGSSLWLRWPEFGLRLREDLQRPGAVSVERWRGDRVKADWPDELHRGPVWPWEGWWKRGAEVDDPAF